MKLVIMLLFFCVTFVSVGLSLSCFILELLMTDEKKKIISADIGNNSFELILRILGNEFVAVKIGSSNFSGKLIVAGIFTGHL